MAVQGETNLMSENKFSRYELLKLKVPFLYPTEKKEGFFHLHGGLTALFEGNELKVTLSNIFR